MCHNEICISKCCKYVLGTIQILRNSEWSRKSFGTRDFNSKSIIYDLNMPGAMVEGEYPWVRKKI